MMPILTTPVHAEPFATRLDMGSTVVSLGSCFADEVGHRLQAAGLSVELNPFGTLYNPASVASALDRLMADQELTTDNLVQHDGLWHSWYHHGSYSRPTPQECLDACNTAIHHAHKTLATADMLIVTFGTAFVFEHEGQVVANCHKLPAQCFVRRRMSVHEVVALWQPLRERLSAFNPRLHVVFTVSPIRHMADGAHGNQLSKSTLLLATEQLVGLQPTLAAYFPAYEIVLDELRDYRFYGPDMAHPTPLAVDIVWERFQEATMTPATRQQAHNNAKQAKRQQHVPLR